MNAKHVSRLIVAVTLFPLLGCEVKKGSGKPDVELYGLAYAVDSLNTKRGFTAGEMATTEGVLSALLDAGAYGGERPNGETKNAALKRLMIRYRIIVNGEAVCVVDLQHKLPGSNSPIVLYFELHRH
jgi:hypothetical protein